ncbi:retrovirus-related pol polyprotein from transposon TNT 1-94 [Tanacetum coccineum]
MDTLGTTPEGGILLGPERPRTYEDLSDTEKKRYDADVRATNIVLQGLPKDIYKLINHNIEAKAIWDNVKMLLAGSELTKEDRESHLYDEFERFKMLPGENINEYYVRFHSCPTPNSPEDDQIVVQNVQGQQNQNQRNFAWGNGVAGFRGTQNRAGNANAGQGKPIKCYNCNGIGHIARNCTQPKRPHNSDYFKDKMLLMQAQENGVVLDEEELLFLAGEQPNTFDADVDNQSVRDLARNEDNIFQADECDAFDSDVDDEPTAQSIFMANLSSAGPTNLQASSSDASILSEVPDLEKANVANNVIPYERYMTINDVSVVPSCASSALNTAYVLIDNNVHTPNEPSVTELAIYKEQVAIYEQHAKFELTKREQRMDDQMRILIQDRNRMEENVESKIWTQLGYDKHGIEKMHGI